MGRIIRHKRDTKMIARCLKFKDGKTVVYENENKINHVVFAPGMFILWQERLGKYKHVSFETLNITYRTWLKRIGGKSCKKVKLTY